MARLNIRDLDEDISAGLDQLRQKSLRSREAEGQFAIAEYVQRHLTKTQPESAADRYRQDLALRLQKALRQVVLMPCFSDFSPTLIAERIGETNPINVVEAFAGEGDIDFSRIGLIARLLGVESNWLKHNRHSAYTSRYFRLQGDLGAVMKELFTGPADNKVTKLHLVRAENKTGQLYVIKEFESGAGPVCFDTPHHISEEIGGGGEGDLTEVFQLLRMLYKDNRHDSPLVLGYLANEGHIRAWQQGDMHPLELVQKSRKSYWWEDVWDIESLKRGECWEGQHRLTRRILNATVSRLAGNQIAFEHELKDRQPTPDELEGLEWWKTINKKERQEWLEKAGYVASPMAAWQTYRTFHIATQN